MVSCFLRLSVLLLSTLIFKSIKKMKAHCSQIINIIDIIQIILQTVLLDKLIKIQYDLYRTFY